MVLLELTLTAAASGAAPATAASTWAAMASSGVATASSGATAAAAGSAWSAVAMAAVTTTCTWGMEWQVGPKKSIYLFSSREKQAMC